MFLNIQMWVEACADAELHHVMFIFITDHNWILHIPPQGIITVVCSCLLEACVFNCSLQGTSYQILLRVYANVFNQFELNVNALCFILYIDVIQATICICLMLQEIFELGMYSKHILVCTYLWHFLRNFIGSLSPKYKQTCNLVFKPHDPEQEVTKDEGIDVAV